MQKKRTSLKILAASSLMVAISIVCGKYLAIPGGEVLRFSFENLPIMMAGMLFGPAVGIAVGVVADLVGCILVGYTVNPLVTLGAAAIGFVSGLVWMLLTRRKTGSYAVNVILSVAAAHIVGSVLIKTFGLAAYYAFPLWELMLWRLLNYAIVGAIEGTLLFILMKNKLLVKQFSVITSVEREPK